MNIFEDMNNTHFWTKLRALGRYVTLTLHDLVAYRSASKYRILEVVSNGNRLFYPQQRFMYFFWEKIVKEGCEYRKEEFFTIEEANEGLYKIHLRHMNKATNDEKMRIIRKDDTTIVHDFDAVFHKLKK